MKTTKSSKAKKVSADDGELSGMFNQMIGAGNIEITYPKYTRIMQNCQNIVRIFDMLAGSPFMVLSDNAGPRAEIELFCANSKEAMAKMFCMDLSGVPDLGAVHEEVSTRFGNLYMEMRRSRFIQEIILVMHKNLAAYKKHLADVDTVTHKFIVNMAGHEWNPFPFTSLNIKRIFDMVGVKTNTISFFLTILSKVYTLCQQINDELNSPDIDIDQFVNVIMSNIETIQKIPELSRCGQAFKKIRESVTLLKSRFDGYYKDFVETNDSSIMMQHFILDVSKETTASPQVTLQFKKIINYYNKVAQNNPNTSSQIKGMLQRFNNTFSNIEKKATEDMVNVREDLDETTDSVLRNDSSFPSNDPSNDTTVEPLAEQDPISSVKAMPN